MKDNVNHPSHYTSHPSGVECISITEHYDFCVGNAIKYCWRAGLKHDTSEAYTTKKALRLAKQKEIEDLKKAVWYLNKKIAQLSEEEPITNQLDLFTDACKR